MPRLAICRLHELTVRLTKDDRAFRLVYGQPYDLDQRYGGIPLAELVGDHLSTFEPVPDQDAAVKGD